MGTYYRWRKSAVQYSSVSGGSIFGKQITFPVESYIDGLPAYYVLRSQPSISPNGTFDFSSAPFSTTIGYGIAADGGYYAASKAPKTYYYVFSRSMDLNVNGSSFLLTNADGNIQNIQSNPGSFQEYVYSTTASAYPNGGVSGGYYYDQCTTIGDINITVPSLVMIGQPVPLSWSSISVSSSTVTYQLQRNVNNSSWENVGSPISSISYTDTAQTGWTQVQYQVAPVIDGITLPYAQSAVIPVSDPNALVISGQDGDLGTITANVPYTVSSNTGNPISLTRKVNQVEVATITIDSGFAYNIPIFDLPTGTNTIELTATVQTTSGRQPTKTRTWSYTKTPMQFTDTGGVAQLVQNGMNIWPITLSESVRVPTYLGGSLDKALQLLSQTSGFVVIAVGEYIGTGTYGQSNPNTLTFDSAPSMVLVYGDNETLIVSSPNTAGTAYIQGNQAKWYSTTSAEGQMNSSGITYNYIAVGKSS